MADKLKPVVAPKTDAFSMIVKYMQDPGAVELTADAERMLKRLMYCDTLLRSNRKTSDEIMTDLQETFVISQFTALRDIKNCQKLFGQARQVNKQYLAHLHLERINKDIEDARDRLFFYEDEDLPGVMRRRTPDAKELAALAKLHQAYSFTLNTAPEEKGQDILPPPIFNFTQVVINTGMTPAQAMAAADQYLNGSENQYLNGSENQYLDGSQAEDAEWQESEDEPDPDDDI
jgi:hypothetical protein